MDFYRLEGGISYFLQFLQQISLLSCISVKSLIVGRSLFSIWQMKFYQVVTGTSVNNGNKKDPFGRFSETSIDFLSEDLKVLYQFVYIKSDLHACEVGRHLPYVVDTETI